jgi:cellulose synthase/poly-beta-1,6-N-acetylglucosamine synthase-like glycosyltransferase
MNRKEKLVFYPLAVVGIALTLVFAFVWFLPQNVPHNFGGYWHAFDFLLFLLLTYVVWHQICNEILLWMITEKMRQPWHMIPKPGYKVAFITTFVPGSEPLELLERIIPALKQVDYPHDTWVLDEGRSRAAREICQKYGVKYFTRHGVFYYNTDGGQFAVKTKGGNHNAWYDAFGHAYDIVAQIDTDFIPRKDFLMRTLGHFNDPLVAFVGTPQIYGNTKRSFVARGAAEQQFTFYGPILRGLYGRDMSMLLGANHVIRVAALKDINYYGAHLTEDLLTGMTLHSKRWKSVYVPEALATGEGPETWLAYFNQQMRWAFGCIDILFHYSPKKLRKMSWEQRRYYLMMMQHYFSGLAMAGGVLVIMLNFLFGIAASRMGYSVLLLYAVLIAWQLLVGRWLQRFNVRPKQERGILFAGKVIGMTVLPIYFLALIGVIRGKRLSFKVTPKGGDQEKYIPLAVFRPHLVIGAIVAIGFGVSFETHDQNPVLIFWAVTTIVAMLGIPLYAWLGGIIKVRRQRRLIRAHEQTILKMPILKQPEAGLGEY